MPTGRNEVALELARRMQNLRRDSHDDDSLAGAANRTSIRTTANPGVT
jgi:hypothetical protein